MHKTEREAPMLFIVSKASSKSLKVLPEWNAFFSILVAKSKIMQLETLPMRILFYVIAKKPCTAWIECGALCVYFSLLNFCDEILKAITHSSAVNRLFESSIWYTYNEDSCCANLLMHTMEKDKTNKQRCGWMIRMKWKTCCCLWNGRWGNTWSEMKELPR
jgi:hypothetical protein